MSAPDVKQLANHIDDMLREQYPDTQVMQMGGVKDNVRCVGVTINGSEYLIQIDKVS